MAHDFFNACEKEAAVGTAEHIARNKIMSALDRNLEKLHLEFDLERWIYISIIMPEVFSTDYPEVAKPHKKIEL